MGLKYVCFIVLFCVGCNSYDINFIFKHDLKEVRYIFEKYADVGDTNADTALGLMYATGIGVNASQPHSLIYLMLGAMDNVPLAQMALGYRYLKGINVKRSCERALDLYRNAASKVIETETIHNQRTRQKYVRLYDDEEHFNYVNSDTHLIDLYDVLASSGHDDAQFEVGRMLLAKEIERAVQYLRMAAESNNANALAALGKMHLFGTDLIKADVDKAREYIKQSADLNHAIGLFYYGYMLTRGMGVTKDIDSGIEYIKRSAAIGYSSALLELGIMNFEGIVADRNFEAAASFFQLASKSDNAFAWYYSARMYDFGFGVKRSCESAVELYKSVAERGEWSKMLTFAYDEYLNDKIDRATTAFAIMAETGYKIAESNAVHLIESHESLTVNAENYVKYVRRAAQQGCSYSSLKLGDYYFYELNDYGNAALYYRNAWNEERNPQGMFNLGYMYEHGLGTVIDIDLAKNCYDLAASEAEDAELPVSLALFKLKICSFYRSFTLMAILNFLIANLDIVIILILQTVYIIIFYLRP